MESPAIRYLWVNVERAIPGVRLGGIYANKPGYHNSRIANRPSNYSVQLLADKQGPGHLASAIDLTLSTEEMKKRTGYLRRAALDPKDNRTSYIREFIGTLNGSDVYCLIASGPGTAFRFDGSRDDSHLWHIHISFYRLYCNDYEAMDAVLSVLIGETYEAWIQRTRKEPINMFFLKVEDNPAMWVSNGLQRRALPGGTYSTMIQPLERAGVPRLTLDSADLLDAVGGPLVSDETPQ